MNILFLAPRFHTNQYEIVKILIKENNKVYFHSKTKGKIENHKLIKPIIFEESRLTYFYKKIFNNPNDNNIIYLPKLIKYYFYLKKFNIDICIIRVHGFLYTYLVSFILRLLNIKIIYYEQTSSNLEFIAGIKLFRKFDFYLRLYLFNAKWFTPLKESNNIKLPKNCYYLPFVASVYKNKTKFQYPLKIITVGKFQKRKNHIFLLKSLLKYFKKNQIYLTIIGEVSNPKHYKNYINVKKFIKENKIEKYINIYKNLDHMKIFNIYTQNNFFVLPSSNEPASISLIEAIGCGLPVICSDSCGTKTYIKEKYNGFIFKTNNSTSLINKLDLFIFDLKLLKKMSNQSYIYANNYLSSNNYLKYFNEIIK